MARSRGIQGEYLFNPTYITVKPSSTLVTQITTWKNAKTTIEGVMYVIRDTSANDQVTVSTTNSYPEMRIEHVDLDSSNTYMLTVLMLGYLNYESVWVPVNHGIYRMIYSSAPSLGQEVKLYTTNCYQMVGATSGGAGKVVSLDTTNGYAYVQI